jgi:hypothetical protein
MDNYGLEAQKSTIHEPKVVRSCCTVWGRGHILSRPFLSFVSLYFIRRYFVSRGDRSHKISQPTNKPVNKYKPTAQLISYSPTSIIETTKWSSIQLTYVPTNNLIYQQSKQPNKENKPSSRAAVLTQWYVYP